MTVSRLELVALGLLACVACASCLAPSIDNEPVKVTHRNSGPRYDIDSNANDEPERVPLTPTGAVQQSGGARGEEPARPDEPAGESGDQMPIGHVSIRRIFLVPMMRPARGDWPEEANGGAGEQQAPQARPAAGDDDNERGQAPAMFAKPFWPFLTPARPVHHPHLFGADEASRSPAAAAARPDQERAESASGAGERESDEPQTKSLRSWLKHRHPSSIDPSESMELPEQRPMFMMRRPAGEQSEPQPLVDPIQMLMEMMQQALGGQLAPPGGKPTDETAAPSEERPKMPAAEGETAEAGDKSPALRPTNNEKREDIVEIEGKKYLRKTVINRHVGENIIFMTKRLIFVPLNETSGEAENASSEQPAIPTSAATVSSTGSSSTTTVAPTNSEETTTAAAAASPAPVKPAEEATTTVATNVPTTTTSTAAGEPASTTEQAASSTAAAATEESLAARAAKAIERAAERLVEKAEGLAEGASSSTTAAPAPSTDKPASV